MKIQPSDLMDRIMRALGAPIVQPNITPNQLYQAIDDALKLYTEFHYNGSYRDYIIIRADKESIDNYSVFTLPDNVLSISKILKHGKGLNMKGLATTDGSTDMWFTTMFQGVMGGFGAGNGCSFGLSSMQGVLPFYTIMEMNIGLWQKQINPETDFVFNSANKTLMVIDAKIQEGSIIVCEAIVSSTMGMYNGGNGAIVGGSTSSSFPDTLYDLDYYDNSIEKFRNPNTVNSYVGGNSQAQGGLDDRWVIEYATAKAKYYWGMNLFYASGVSQSSGGAKIDGDLLRDEAEIEMNRLKDEVRGMGHQPIMMMG